MDHMTVRDAENLARTIQRKNRFLACDVAGDRLYVKAVDGNAFAFVCSCAGQRPDMTPSWQRLEDSGAALHAGRDLAGQEFYTGLATWDTFVHHIAYPKAISLMPSSKVDEAGTSRIWRMGEPEMPGFGAQDAE